MGNAIHKTVVRYRSETSWCGVMIQTAHMQRKDVSGEWKRYFELIWSLPPQSGKLKDRIIN